MRDSSPSRGAKFTLLLFFGEPCLEEREAVHPERSPFFVCPG
nr:MAG TPA: hypothetical protein [Caudoviricetes sp.]